MNLFGHFLFHDRNRMGRRRRGTHHGAAVGGNPRGSRERQCATLTGTRHHRVIDERERFPDAGVHLHGGPARVPGERGHQRGTFARDGALLKRGELSARKHRCRSGFDQFSEVDAGDLPRTPLPYMLTVGQRYMRTRDAGRSVGTEMRGQPVRLALELGGRDRRFLSDGGGCAIGSRLRGGHLSRNRLGRTRGQGRLDIGLRQHAAGRCGLLELVGLLVVVQLVHGVRVLQGIDDQSLDVQQVRVAHSLQLNRRQVEVELDAILDPHGHQ
ncbi:Uncharacterised protein [Mycobacteroides abscessus subsp. abscessus]|nr:Uncharacterised protein [Mycobacteroides abscessus subsp. abscessus]